MKMKRRLGPMARGAAIVSLLLLAGCDPDSIADPAVSASCSAIGARCQRPEGPVGVCQESPCPPDATSRPCFSCTNQH